MRSHAAHDVILFDDPCDSQNFEGGLSVQTLFTTFSSVSDSVLTAYMRAHHKLGDFKREYPSAKLIAVEEAIKKKTAEGLKFDGGTFLVY